jgi:hypothetical protein
MTRNPRSLFALCGIFTISLAQPNQWQLTLSSGSTISNCGLLKVDGDSLNVVRDSTYQWIKVASITEVRFVREAKALETANSWAIYMENAMPKYFGVVLAAPILALYRAFDGVVGFVLVLVEGHDSVFDFAPMKPDGKLTTLHAIIENRISY